MPVLLKRILLAATLLLLLSYAYSPLVRAAFVGEDFPVLIDAGRLAWPEMRPVPEGAAEPEPFRLADLYTVRGTDERPLAALSLALSSRLFSDRGHWDGTESRLVRGENLLLLAAAAIALSRFVRRMLVPWTGSEHASAAGWASAVLFLLHPLSLSSVATVSSRGDVLALAIGIASAAAFLRGRQERQYGFVVLAGLGAILIGMCSELSMFLPPILAIGEFVSARRYRPMIVRLRTAGTTLLVFGGAITLEALLRYALSESLTGPAYARSLAALTSGENAETALAFTTEKLGVLLLPVNTFGIGLSGYAIAGVLALVAAQPALVAARAAPRLWIWLIVAWFVSILFTALPHALVRVHPGDLTHARVLFPAAAVMAVGLAVTSTSLSGARRTVLPIVIAMGLAVLAHGNARPWMKASDAVEEMRADLADARVLHGKELRLLVLDPPESVEGLDAVRPALAWMLDPAFTTEAAEPVAADRVRGLDYDAFRMLTREPEFTALRRAGLIVVFPERLLVAEAGLDAGRKSVRVSAVAESQDPRLWRGDGRSPDVDLEALQERTVRARALPEVDTESAPTLGFRARGALCERGELTGAWVAGEDGQEAYFDVERSLCWLLGGRIRRIWFEEALSRVVSAEVLERPLRLVPGVAPRTEGGDWRIDLDAGALPVPRTGEAVWRLELLDVATFARVELPATLDAGGLVVPDAATRAAELLEGERGPVAWSLEYRIDDVTVARERGRRLGRLGELPGSESGPARAAEAADRDQ